MPKYAEFSPIAPQPTPVIGWYDTDLIDYPNLPETLLTLTDQQWEDRMSQIWLVESGNLVPFVPPPPTIASQANALLGGTVTVIGNYALNGDYGIDSATQLQITGVAAAISAGLGLPGSGETFNWPDSTGHAHQWTAPQFILFAKKVMDYVYNCMQVIQGHGDVLPNKTLDIS